MLKKGGAYFKARRAVHMIIVDMIIQNFVIVSSQRVINNHYHILSYVLELLVISIVLYFLYYALQICYGRL